MSEKDAIAAVPAPVTQVSLLSGLRALGIRRGDTLIVHSAMSKLGWICGKEEAVVRALLAAVGRTGTLVMPAHSGDNSEPADWANPPVPPSWFEIIRESTPAYDRRVTPTRGMGRIAECFRKTPGTRRSAHPQVSWCARGPGAAWLLRGHTYRKPCFGMGSPLGRLYRRNAKILLLGVGYDNCTALHLAEVLYPGTKQTEVGAAVRVHGQRRWVRWREIEMDSERFPRIGEAYEKNSGEAVTGRLGAADCMVLRVRSLVDFGLDWLTKHTEEMRLEAVDVRKADE
ncbi:MAG: AAC(3) family N-acetyltransferase [Eubacteriales bacterium]|nr:AAC(3) family N-acetyltransferase [Eubacteriales bacterium]